MSVTVALIVRVPLPFEYNVDEWPDVTVGFDVSTFTEYVVALVLPIASTAVNLSVFVPFLKPARFLE